MVQPFFFLLRLLLNNSSHYAAPKRSSRPSPQAPKPLQAPQGLARPLHFTSTALSMLGAGKNITTIATRAAAGFFNLRPHARPRPRPFTNAPPMYQPSLALVLADAPGLPSQQPCAGWRRSQKPAEGVSMAKCGQAATASGLSDPNLGAKRRRQSEGSDGESGIFRCTASSTPIPNL